ncbi:MAG: FKBP-type peptidyl-prolyl cis-trans isomerase [Clostridia bacterium]|nr:FKBP-type peptidyl-prolyl cis-trans isomerase [Clostridia bacterium]
MNKIFLKLSAGLLAALMLVSCNGQKPTDDNKPDDSKPAVTNPTVNDTTGDNPDETVPTVKDPIDMLALDIGKYVELSDLSELEIDLNVYCDDEALEAGLVELAAGVGYYREEKNRLTQRGDVLNIDFAGSIDGVYFDGGTATDAPITLDEITGYIDGFDADLYGIMPGTTVKTKVKFPDNYKATELAGLEAVFEITVNYIYDYFMTDENVSELTKGEYTSLADFRVYYRKQMIIENLKNFDNNKWSLILEAVNGALEIKEYPEGLVEYYHSQMLVYYYEYADYYGVTLKEFYEMAGISEESVLKSAQDYARDDLLCAAVCNQAGIVLSEADYISMLDQLAAQLGYKNKYELEAEQGKTYFKNYFAGQLCNKYLMENIKVNTDYDQYKHLIETKPETTGGTVTGD